ncbi:L-amino acid N-acyltransferase YncA [Lewinella marina]|uniref:GNAT family N-acetyltransferase n=1 Tax=Neolewinella marina TaxID=438751 RepID=A0A2G0CKG5_9BACT|nr:GNAT family N-acetyltransferase [Neolewinella marina]NJB84337.1 L-amino acid N-acyltransferase YncA [Neolewinella marina]PHL00463.1 GNAT family N-acetyltransferase [Neolewinella marina]
MHLREATPADHDAVWDIFHAVIRTGDTYVYPPDTPRADLQRYWFADYMHTFVVEAEGEVVGTYIIKANQPGLGDHVANCSYMVGERARGRGVGKLMCEHSIEFARRSGYRAIQFNIVVSTNVAAVKLWQQFGFRIIGTTSQGFRHATRGLVDTYIMYREL